MLLLEAATAAATAAQCGPVTCSVTSACSWWEHRQEKYQLQDFAWTGGVVFPEILTPPTFILKHLQVHPSSKFCCCPPSSRLAFACCPGHFNNMPSREGWKDQPPDPLLPAPLTAVSKVQQPPLLRIEIPGTWGSCLNNKWRKIRINY